MSTAQITFVDPRRDTWRTVGGDDGPMVTITPCAKKLLTLQQWHGVRKQWPDEMAVGVLVPNDAPIEALVPDLPRIALIALQFPKWVDGRAYSQARLLRRRWRYAGEIRATGEVLIDMLPLLMRTGFDQAVLRGDQDRAAAERALGFVPDHYQGDAREPRPLYARAMETAA